MLIFSVGCFTCLPKMCLAETPGRHGEALIDCDDLQDLDLSFGYMRQLAIGCNDLQDLDLSFSYMRHSIDCDDLQDLDLSFSYMRHSTPWPRSSRASRPPRRCR